MAHLGQLGTSVGEKVAHGHDFDIGMILKTKLRAEFAHAVSDDANANFAVRNWLPSFCQVRVLGHFLESLDGLLSRTGDPPDPESGGADTNRLQERTPGDGDCRSVFARSCGC